MQGNEALEVAAILEEEQVELLPEVELARLREIDALTGQPHKGDVLHHAIPMCGPISAMQSYKYRLKVTPGSQRKGRAARQVSLTLALLVLEVTDLASKQISGHKIDWNDNQVYMRSLGVNYTYQVHCRCSTGIQSLNQHERIAAEV